MASFVHSFRYHSTDHIAKEYRILKRQKPHIFSSQPRVGSDIRANFITTYSVYLLSDDPEMSQVIFIFLIFGILLVLFIYLSYIFISYIYFFFFYSFIFLFSAVRRPPSSSSVSFRTLQTPVSDPHALSAADDRYRYRFNLESHDVLCMWRDAQNVLILRILWKICRESRVSDFLHCKECYWSTPFRNPVAHCMVGQPSKTQ